MIPQNSNAQLPKNFRSNTHFHPKTWSSVFSETPPKYIVHLFLLNLSLHNPLSITQDRTPFSMIFHYIISPLPLPRILTSGWWKSPQFTMHPCRFLGSYLWAGECTRKKVQFPYNCVHAMFMEERSKILGYLFEILL